MLNKNKILNWLRKRAIMYQLGFRDSVITTMEGIYSFSDRSFRDLSLMYFSLGAIAGLNGLLLSVFIRFLNTMEIDDQLIFNISYSGLVIIILFFFFISILIGGFGYISFTLNKFKFNNLFFKTSKLSFWLLVFSFLIFYAVLILDFIVNFGL
jgi:heme/copper-type cytochrome/quinol oxidase subunit 1